MCTSSVFFSSDWYEIYAYIFNSRRICAQVLYSFLLIGIRSVVAYSIPEGYVHKFCILFFFWLVWDLCLHIQFLEDMCTSGLGVLTYEEVLAERSTGENDLLKSVLVTH